MDLLYGLIMGAQFFFCHSRDMGLVSKKLCKAHRKSNKTPIFEDVPSKILKTSGREFKHPGRKFQKYQPEIPEIDNSCPEIAEI